MKRKEKREERKKREPKIKQENYFDYSLLFVIIFVACFGLVMIYSSSYYTAELSRGDGTYYVRRQAMVTLLGVAAMLIISRIDYHIYTKFWVIGLLVSLVLMIATDFTPLGVEINYAKRWIGINGRALFQSSEVVKIAIIVAMAVCLTKWYKQLNRPMVIFLLLLMVLPLFLLVAKENLSTGIIILGIPVAMYFVASKEYKIFGYMAVGLVILVIVAVIAVDRLVEMGILQVYQASRILVWQNPEAYSQNGGYQVLQGLYAIGSGGFFGKGLGNSVQKLNFLPEAQNDMIFSIICEELGLFGAICVLLLFCFMLYRFMVIANNAPDMLGSMLVIGIMAHIAIQVILNVAVVSNLIPNTGISLPFISYGGTSLAFLFAEMGIALGVSRRIITE